MRKIKIIIPVLILFITIGFAAINFTLGIDKRNMLLYGKRRDAYAVFGMPSFRFRRLQGNGKNRPGKPVGGTAGAVCGDDPCKEGGIFLVRTDQDQEWKA